MPNKKIDTRTKGQIAQLIVELEATKRNYIVSLPTTAVRYDAILDDGKKAYKAQIKYLTRKKGGRPNARSLCLYSRRRAYNISKHKTYSRDEIDLLLVYLPEINEILCFTPKYFHGKRVIEINLVNPTTPSYYKNFIW